ncbi:Tim44 domain-containing protein [Verminephrobacter aporrectodeae subsp. tuberculatae]|uniref:Tim44 domain-containing protein n=1 Tax=Verminephrobacter aporrectodeae subsp. tuberculatae TaxID=1110392 RepID=A0ABT3KSQ8_9BURK|nr:Tim44-like domain-containing protein [Verminephrobacter aporrectodeae]MCW5222282.1 Tim44 domain-containing protein [Verminephrobacter aporrectodeae subsp. tuberculatae]MCW5287746.1 Tim44 domain-containing protein [Verminephrobacter aporrectodeae subsp. tuberculatae]MCW5321311.1 Tim44 domain-containing protein [Verminephrobacter aporrectodeae subsp. tuberculatae]MCW8165445.1 Tim44 domain-containing protein [Verminephrobacter aporrectodeae subsp. tuberculatae]MCW8170013.1 Tim44 domain-contain
MQKLWSVVLVAALALVHADADARRLGGGKSVGRQSGNVTQRESAAPSAPAQNATNAAAAKPATAAPPAAAAKKPWGAMLGGLAAGLGLAWLAHSLGLGAGFGQALLIGLFALLAYAAFKMLMRSRQGGSALAFQGADAAQAPAQYSPGNVGNDASARPWERGATNFDSGRQPQGMQSGSGTVIGSGLSGAQNWSIPEGFDMQGFLSAAKRNFVTLQAAWDGAEIDTLRSMMTDSMLGEIRTQLKESTAQRGAQPNHTDVVMIEAQLLGIEDLGDDYMASVEFSGMIREEPSAGPSPFREVWNMTKPKTGNMGWLVAGVQALQ